MWLGWIYSGSVYVLDWQRKLTAIGYAQNQIANQIIRYDYYTDYWFHFEGDRGVTFVEDTSCGGTQGKLTKQMYGSTVNGKATETANISTAPIPIIHRGGPNVDPQTCRFYPYVGGAYNKQLKWPPPD